MMRARGSSCPSVSNRRHSQNHNLGRLHANKPRLGPDSPAWQLWQLLYDMQQGARSAGRGVTVGKLLHDKRPRLIPVFDRKRISKALAIDHRHFWEAIWCDMRDPETRARLRDIRASVDQAAHLTLLRASRPARP